MFEVAIREAECDDLDDLVALNTEVQSIHHDARPDYFKNPDQAAVRAWLRDCVRDTQAHIWLALREPEQRCCGYVLVLTHSRTSNPFCPPRRWCEIDQIAVAEKQRGGGIGRTLVAHAIADAKRRGIDSVELGVWEFNDAARAAFERLGFRTRTRTMEFRHS